MTDLTPRQLEAFEFVSGYIKANRKSPTVREVAEGLGLKSPHPAYRLLWVLYDKGYITWTSTARSIKILKRPKKVAARA